MKVRAIVVVLSTALVTTVGLAPTAATGASSGSMKVLIVGDSVTQGWRGDITWRYWFSRSRPDLDLVGNKRGTTDWGDWDYRGADAYANSDFDQDHAAVYGGRLGDTNPDPRLHQLPIDVLTETYAPDVVVGFWGLNDLGVGVHPADVVAMYSMWITDARAQQPDVDFVIVSLPQTWYDGVPEFNAGLAPLAARRSTGQSRVVIGTMVDDYTQDQDFRDRVHPSATGEVKIAHMVEAAIDELEALNAQPAQPTPTPTETTTPSATPPLAAPAATATAVPTAPPITLTPPALPRRLRAVSRALSTGPRITLTWRAASRAERYDVRCGRSARTTDRLRIVIRSGASSCRVRSINEAGRSSWRKVRVTSG